jgi:uroporphyrin-III C-methyltransferase
LSRPFKLHLLTADLIGAGPDGPAIGQLVAGGTTVVIYMGISRCADITSQLMTQLPSHWPAAVVQHASGSAERLLQTTLAELPALVAQGAIQSPSVIVLGPVVQSALNAALQGAAPTSVAMDASAAAPEHPSWPLLEQSM